MTDFFSTFWRLKFDNWNYCATDYIHFTVSDADITDTEFSSQLMILWLTLSHSFLSSNVFPCDKSLQESNMWNASINAPINASINAPNCSFPFATCSIISRDCIIVGYSLTTDSQADGLQASNKEDLHCDSENKRK